ncbi:MULTISPECIES: cupin domain-containing protein [Pantoea]|uniref:cupin domain-containing protein n=1 Tax=Pantoea TaxID=53335 RepID=UPI000D765FAA|nr:MULTISPECIES: cupin domain-containing protein [Pantoea]MEB6535383.1 cupin domain-containing protein [Pantoea stewartii]PXV76578.1 hypothetical protein C7433_102258 [Pantoea sp. PNA 03-3]
MLKWNKLIIALTTIFFMNTVIAKTRVEKKILLQTERSWDGNIYHAYPNGTPEITVLKVEIPPVHVLPWHYHKCISTVYMTHGSVTLTMKNAEKKITFSEGDTFSDTVNSVHQGISGSQGAGMLVFFACSKNTPLTTETTNNKNPN